MDRVKTLPTILEIEDVALPIILEYAKRKTLSIRVTNEIRLQIKAPFGTSEREIYRFLQQKRFWIYKQAKRMIECNVDKVERSEEEIQQLRELARAVLRQKSYQYAEQLGVSFTRIRIGNQRTRWGSCSSKGTISYNWRLVLMPERIQDYVVVHELCHLLEMNHSPRFWQLVGSVIPDYTTRRTWLKEHGNEY